MVKWGNLLERKRNNASFTILFKITPNTHILSYDTCEVIQKLGQC